MLIETINPATGKVINCYNEMTADKITEIIDATHCAQLKWREVDLGQRAFLMYQLADQLNQRKSHYARLMAEEMGKPLVQGEKEIEKCAWVCAHYAENAADYLQPRMIKTDMSCSYVMYQPLGVLLAIMPWNFPFWQIFRFAVPTLMAGNGILLKHAPIVTGTALAIEQLLVDAGFLPNLFRSLVMTESTAEKVIAHPKIAAITLTGSPQAGKMVGIQAAKALKKIVLELGGSDPYVILEDADLAIAAEACVTSRMHNAGQVCVAAKRLITVGVMQQKKLLGLLQEKLKTYTMGDPLEPQTTLGPLARKDIRDQVHAQVQKSIAKGARLIMGGTIPPQQGFYYPPTILTDVKKGMPAYEEEIFGPVLALITAKNEEEAISIANDTGYGLGAAIFTTDLQRGEKIATEKIQAGICAINTFVSSDPRLPFGGIKGSGYGRELSIEGIQTFTNIKTINIK